MNIRQRISNIDDGFYEIQMRIKEEVNSIKDIEDLLSDEERRPDILYFWHSYKAFIEDLFEGFIDEIEGMNDDEIDKEIYRLVTLYDWPVVISYNWDEDNLQYADRLVALGREGYKFIYEFDEGLIVSRYELTGDEQGFILEQHYS